MRLIDADALLKHEIKRCDGEMPFIGTCLTNNFTLKSEIDKFPTIDAVSVVHGEWEWNDNGMDWGIGCWKCSNCHHKPESNWETARNINPNTWNGSHYCPNCGAMMDGVSE